MVKKENTPGADPKKYEKLLEKVNELLPQALVEFKTLLQNTPASYWHHAETVFASQDPQKQELLKPAFRDTENTFQFQLDLDDDHLRHVFFHTFVHIWIYLKEKKQAYAESLSAFEKTEEWSELLEKITRYLIMYTQGVSSEFNLGEAIFDEDLKEKLGVEEADIKHIFILTSTWEGERSSVFEGEFSNFDHLITSQLPVIGEFLGWPTLVRSKKLPNMALSDKEMAHLLSYFSIPQPLEDETVHLEKTYTEATQEKPEEDMWLENLMEYHESLASNTQGNLAQAVEEDILTNCLLFVPVSDLQKIFIPDHVIRWIEGFAVKFQSGKRMDQYFYENLQLELNARMHSIAPITVEVPYQLHFTVPAQSETDSKDELDLVANDDEYRNAKRAQYTQLENDDPLKKETKVEIVLSFTAACEITPNPHQRAPITHLLPQGITNSTLSVKGVYTEKIGEKYLLKIIEQAVEKYEHIAGITR